MTEHVRAMLGARGTRKLREELRRRHTTGTAYTTRAILAALVEAPESWVRDVAARGRRRTSVLDDAGRKPLVDDDFEL